MAVWDVQNLVLIVLFLRHKHLLQLQVQTFNAPSQPRNKSVQWHQGHRLSDAGCVTCRQGVVGLLASCRRRGVTGAFLQLVPQLGHLPQVFGAAPRCRALVSAHAPPPSGLLSPRAWSLSGLVVGTGDRRALGLFGPLPLQVGGHDGVQGKGSADGGLGRSSRGSVRRLDLPPEQRWAPVELLEGHRGSEGLQAGGAAAAAAAAPPGRRSGAARHPPDTRSRAPLLLETFLLLLFSSSSPLGRSPLLPLSTFNSSRAVFGPLFCDAEPWFELLSQLDSGAPGEVENK